MPYGCGMWHTIFYVAYPPSETFGPYGWYAKACIKMYEEVLQFFSGRIPAIIDMSNEQFKPGEGRWSSLLEDVLGSILDRLPYMDHLRFGAVCKSWSLVAAKKLYRPARQIPWLMLLSEEKSESCGFYCLSDKKVRTLNLPEFRGMRCVGSSDGWLVTLDKRADISLWNPFSKARIQLPLLATLPRVWDVVHDSKAGTTQYVLSSHTDNNGEEPFSIPAKKIRDTFIWKAVLSSQPALTGDCSDCAVMIIFGELYELAFCKVGDKSWTALEGRCRPYDDIIFYKDQFYAVGNSGSIVAWDVFGPSPPTAKEVPFLGDRTHQKKYLVELGGDLLQVVRCGNRLSIGMPITTVKFKVYKLNWNTLRWTKVKCIGDYVLFLGGNRSMSLSARDFSECRGNHIYFCDDNWDMLINSPEGGHDLGIYNIEDGSFDQYYGSNSQIIIPPPIWFTPNPY